VLFPLSPALWLWEDSSIPTHNFFITMLRWFFDKSITGQSMQAGGAMALAESGVAPYPRHWLVGIQCFPDLHP
jgi:hypothetical protein